VLTSPGTDTFTKVALKSGLKQWLTVTVSVAAAEAQPVDVSVKVKVTFPGPKVVTTPPLVTVATDGLLLAMFHL
jgi:hypothetical protein